MRETSLGYVCTGSYFSKQWTVLSNRHFISVNYKKNFGARMLCPDS